MFRATDKRRRANSLVFGYDLLVVKHWNNVYLITSITHSFKVLVHVQHSTVVLEPKILVSMGQSNQIKHLIIMH